MTASVVMDISSSTALGAVWVGTGGHLKLSQVSTFGMLDLAIITTVTLKNTGPNNLTLVDYMRNINPHHEAVSVVHYSVHCSAPLALCVCVCV